MLEMHTLRPEERPQATALWQMVFGDEKAVCPQCGEKDIERLVSAPSPLKTGAFPFKVGPVHSRVAMNKNLAKPVCSGACSGSVSNE